MGFDRAMIGHQYGYNLVLKWLFNQKQLTFLIYPKTKKAAGIPAAFGLKKPIITYNYFENLDIK